jgi:hypothetical protein
MVAILHDVEHAHRVRSPMRGLVAAIKGLLPQDAVRWYQDLEARDGPIDPGVAFYSDFASEAHVLLTRGLTAAGRKELLCNALEVKCRPGDVVINAGDGGKSMGLVLSGAARIEQAGRVIAELGRGELFGETAIVLKRNHTASVVAAGSDTRVLMLSQSCLARLSNPSDVAQVWLNLARIIANRQCDALQ